MIKLLVCGTYSLVGTPHVSFIVDIEVIELSSQVVLDATVGSIYKMRKLQYNSLSTIDRVSISSVTINPF